MHFPKVLITTPNRAMHRMGRMVWGDFGMEVFFCAPSFQAVKTAAAKESFSVFVLDAHFEDGNALHTREYLVENGFAGALFYALGSTERDAAVYRGRGFEKYVLKPVDIGYLMLQIGRRLGCTKEGQMRRDLEECIEEKMEGYGLKREYAGFRYLTYLLIWLLPDTVIHERGYLTKTLYPEAAKFFHVSASSVERDIRYALKKAWEAGGMPGREKPMSNSVFVNEMLHQLSKEEKNRRWRA